MHLLNSCRGMSRLTTLVILLLMLFINQISAFIPGIYCGLENCYDVLGVERDATKSEIAKAYRRLAKLYHPDMHKDPEDKKTYEEKFITVASAYETLRDEEARNEYDYMLDNPDEVYRHYYYYYRRRMAPKVDVRIVVAVTITVISAVQYYSAWSNYKTAISYFSTVPKYRMQAVHIAKEQGLLDANSKKRRRNKEEVKEEEELIIKQVISDKMDIRGGFGKPSVYNILWIQLVLLPYHLFLYIKWYLRWIYKFRVKGEEYGLEEKEYLIRKNMKMSEGQWESLEASKKHSYLRLELWILQKFKVWKNEQEEEMKRKLAESARYRSYRRMMKNNPPGQMTFAED